MTHVDYSYISGSSPEYIAFGASSIGKLHLDAGKPCQDAYTLTSGSYRNTPWACFAVADGHGGEDYASSDIGSALACKAAGMAFENILHLCIDNFESLERTFKSQFGIEIQRYWQGLCRHHFRSRQEKKWPSSSEDSSQADEIPADKTIENDISNQQPPKLKDFVEYGTTLSVCILFREHLFLFRVGDSDIALLDHDGKAFFVFKDDLGLVGSQTHSLCMPNMAEKAQHELYPALDYKAVWLCTDGVTNCYSMNKKFFKLLTEMNSMLIKKGTEKILSDFPKLVSNMGAEGSGDDSTMIFLSLPKSIDKDKLSDKPVKNSEPAQTKSDVQSDISLDPPISVGVLKNKEDSRSLNHLPLNDNEQNSSLIQQTKKNEQTK